MARAAALGLPGVRMGMRMAVLMLMRVVMRMVVIVLVGMSSHRGLLVQPTGFRGILKTLK
jgi:hypothetical protein